MRSNPNVVYLGIILGAHYFLTAGIPLTLILLGQIHWISAGVVGLIVAASGAGSIVGAILAPCSTRPPASGYSGDGAAALYAVMSGEFDVLETSVNILDQESISLTLPSARQRSVGVVAKRPIANAV